jgi:hypothetical protein
MTKTYYLSDTYDNSVAWVFATLDEAQVVMDSMKIADSKNDDENHYYEITEELPF